MRKNPFNPTGQTEQEREEAAVIEAKKLLQILDPLLENPQFQAFWKQFGEEYVLKYRRITLDPKTPADERDLAAKLHHYLNEVFESPMVKRKAAIDRIQAHEKRERERLEHAGKRHPAL